MMRPRLAQRFACALLAAACAAACGGCAPARTEAPEAIRSEASVQPEASGTTGPEAPVLPEIVAALAQEGDDPLPLEGASVYRADLDLAVELDVESDREFLQAFARVLGALSLAPGAGPFELPAPFTVTLCRAGGEDVFAFSAEGVAVNGEPYRPENPGALRALYDADSYYRLLTADLYRLGEKLDFSAEDVAQMAYTMGGISYGSDMVTTTDRTTIESLVHVIEGWTVRGPVVSDAYGGVDLLFFGGGSGYQSWKLTLRDGTSRELVWHGAFDLYTDGKEEPLTFNRVGENADWENLDGEIVYAELPHLVLDSGAGDPCICWPGGYQIVRGETVYEHESIIEGTLSLPEGAADCALKLIDGQGATVWPDALLVTLVPRGGEDGKELPVRDGKLLLPEFLEPGELFVEARFPQERTIWYRVGVNLISPQ